MVVGWMLLRNGQDIFDSEFKNRLENVLNLNEPLMIAYYLTEEPKEFGITTVKRFYQDYKQIKKRLSSHTSIILQTSILYVIFQ